MTAQAGFQNNYVDDRPAGEGSQAPWTVAAGQETAPPLRKGQLPCRHLPSQVHFHRHVEDCHCTARRVCPAQLTCITALMMLVTEKRFQPQE